MDLPSHMSQIRFADDFDEYRARATSGGSLYGLLRRQAFARRSLRHPPEDRIFVRQRSKSLIPKSVALPEEKSIMKMLCEYTETTRRQIDLEQRRHSTACVLHRRRSPSPSPRRRIRSGSRNILGEAPSKRDDVFTSQQATNLNPLETGDVSKSADKCDVKASPSSSKMLMAPGDNLLKLPGADLSASSPQASTSSASSQAELPTPPMLCRRRSFTLTSTGGIVNEGDEVVNVPQPGTQSPSNQLGSTGSDLHLLGTDRSRASSFNSVGSACSGGSSDNPAYRILMLGGPGVGKSALTQQFLTSEYMAAQNTSFDDGVEYTVPVLLDGEETVMEVIDLPYTGEPRIWREYDVDGYIIIYSIIDRRSFQKAVDLLYDIRQNAKYDSCIVILVANKTDLVRSRIVAEKEAKTAAETYNCKYIELSSILNHKVDNLLVGIVKQIRLKPERERKCRKQNVTARGDSGDTSCVAQCRSNSLFKLFGSTKTPSRSCENLLYL